MSAQISPLTEAILQGFKLGVPPEQISEDLSNLYKCTITPEYVLDIGMKAGIVNDRLSSNWRKKIPDLIAQGMCAKEIAKVTGKEITTVRAAANRLGLKMPFQKMKVDICRERFIAGEKVCDIARSLGVASPMVSKAISPIKDKQTGGVKAEFQGMTVAEIRRKICKRYGKQVKQDESNHQTL